MATPRRTPVPATPPCRAELWALIAAMAALPAAAGGAVPAPKDTPARIIVSGRTSTAQDVAVLPVGQEIPAAFSTRPLHNTPQFAWYVSRHFALKTDYPEAQARHYLTLLELAYPHLVGLFGAEPPGLDARRMPVVYASSKDRLRQALLSEGIMWDFRGGGITYESGFRCSFVYPSGSLRYHQRYILLHEATHLFQMCLSGTTYNTPEWFYEGAADALANHVYEEGARRLTAFVLDKPATIDFLDEGLRSFRRKARTAEEIALRGGDDRGQSFLLANFFLTDPDRLQKLRLWRDEMLARPRYDRQLSERTLLRLFGPWSQTNPAFEAWWKGLANTFHYAEWGWEQDAETLWSYGFAPDAKLSRTDVYLPPGQKALYSPFRMDYPLQPASPLVGPVQRGVEEPAIGCLIDFSRNPASGRAGMGLGLMERGGKSGKEDKDDKDAVSFLAVLIDRGSRLVVDGTDVGLPRKEVPLPAELMRAMAAGGHRVGMTIRIGKSELEVLLRAGAGAGTGQPFRAAVAITPDLRLRLLDRPLAILARDGYHGVTPFCDDARRAEPDLSKPAPANRWRNPGDDILWRLYRAEWRLGDKAPPALTAIKRTMLEAVTRRPEAQEKALDAFDRAAGDILKAVRDCPADAKAVASAASDLQEAIARRTPSAE